MTQRFGTDRSPGIAQQSVLPGPVFSDSPLFWSMGIGCLPRINASGGDLTSGDVVVDDLTTARSVTSTTNSPDFRTTYVVPRTIDTDFSLDPLTVVNGDEIPMFGPGAYVPHCSLDATAVSVDEYLKHSTTAKKLTGTGVIAGAGVPPPIGACAIAKAAKGAGAGQIAIQLLPSLPVAVHGQRKSYPYVTKVNTAAEETIFTETLEGGGLGPNGEMRLRLVFTTRNGTGAPRIFTLTLKLGGTTLYSYGPSMAANADASHRGVVEIDLLIRNAGAQNAQNSVLKFHFADTAAAGSGITTWGSDQVAHKAHTIDLSVDQTFMATLTMAVADAAAQWYLGDCVREGPFYHA